MAEQKNDRIHPESVVLDIGQDIGALIIYTDAELRGREIEVSPLGSAATRVHVEVLERRVNGRPVFAAVFPKLRAGGYEIWGISASPSGTASIVGGEITTVDWR
jgi:phosphoserine phosphatase